MNIVMYRLIPSQRLGKESPAEAYGRNNKTSIVRQRMVWWIKIFVDSIISVRLD
jgi:hypothetical protein